MLHVLLSSSMGRLWLGVLIAMAGLLVWMRLDWTWFEIIPEGLARPLGIALLLVGAAVGLSGEL